MVTNRFSKKLSPQLSQKLLGIDGPLLPSTNDVADSRLEPFRFQAALNVGVIGVQAFKDFNQLFFHAVQERNSVRFKIFF